MKRANTIFAVILLVMAWCGGCNQSSNRSDDLITVDVTANYPEKELILQDFMDVEYIALETTDEFVCQGIVFDVGKQMMIVRNQINDGNIFLFDRKGKGLRVINRWGQGPEEYTTISGITLDEDNGEIFVREIAKGILVYDLYGNFSRRIPLNEDVSFSFLQNYDRDHLICGESTFNADEKSTESQLCTIISKKDGSIVNAIRMHFEKGVNTRVSPEGGNINIVILLSAMVKAVLPYHDSWILTELSSDTIFKLLPDLSMTPFMARTPSVHTMNPELFLLPVILTDRYYFLEMLKKEAERRPGFFPRTKLIFDRQEKAIYRYTLSNNDYTTPKPIELSIGLFSNINNEIAYLQKIEAYQLIESNEKGELKGRLKEVAAELDNDSNPVIMLVKHRR